MIGRFYLIMVKTIVWFGRSYNATKGRMYTMQCGQQTDRMSTCSRRSTLSRPTQTSRPIDYFSVDRKTGLPLYVY